MLLKFKGQEIIIKVIYYYYNLKKNKTSITLEHNFKKPHR